MTGSYLKLKAGGTFYLKVLYLHNFKVTKTYRVSFFSQACLRGQPSMSSCRLEIRHRVFQPST